MAKTGYFNDAPILAPEDDHFGIDRFAQALAKSIREIESPVGATIAINGPWGSGKSSAVNLIRYHLESDVRQGKLELIDFKCWWFRGEEALTLAFLQELNSALQKNLIGKAKELIPRLGKTLLQAGPVVGPAINLATGGIWGALTTGSMDFTKRFFSEGESIEKIFQRLSKALEEQGKRFVVFIDDIDRLAPNEALLIFRLVKSVGRLPNVMYLLVFDRELAEKTVAEMYPSEGPHFLEKIIQASFEIPLPARDDLNTAALNQIGTLCGPLGDTNQLRRFMNIFYDAVSPYLNTPRDLTRLSNAMAISWPAVAREVDIADYVALEVMRLFEPLLYNAIRMSKDRLCGLRHRDGSNEDPEKEIQSFLKIVPERRHDQTKLALMRLFPRLEKTGYAWGFIERWEAERLVCTEKHFDTYFRMGIGDETLSMVEIDGFVQHCGDAEFVKEAFRKAVGAIRKNGKSKVPLLLDEINVHASRIAKENFQPLITAIFEIADEIYREEDREGGMYSFGNTYVRIHWLIRKLILERCNLDERSDIFLEACENAQIGWLVDFATSAIEDHFPREGGEPEAHDKCLVKKECIPELKSHTITAIKSAAESGELVSHPRLLFILFRWRELAENDVEAVKEWASRQLQEDKAVSVFARAFTSESWSHGMGMCGLGDRVAIRNVRASVEGLESIIDPDAFRGRLEELEDSSTLDTEQKDDIVTFLNAWRKQEAGRDR